jgi:phospholipid-binding lipoprotein MlaA
MRRVRRASFALAIALLLLSPPAGAESNVDPPTPEAPQDLDDFDEDLDYDPASGDPWEPANRLSFGLNEVLDTVLFGPLTDIYQFAVPEPARRGVYRMFANLNSPSILMNDLLQMRFGDAAKTTGRLVVNTFFGFGGMFDAAKEAGWEAHHSDFGQTMALVGVPSGPYVVIPVFGPSTVRDGVGDLVDRMFQPLTYFIGPTPVMVFGAGEGLSIRDQKAKALEALKESSVDFYAVLRSAYFQNREAEIWSHSVRDVAEAARLAAVASE